MSIKSMGEIISENRKEKGMTQSELANKMNVTDKAVSKWERNISCPDINSINKLANILGISVEELISSKIGKANTYNNIFDIILLGVALAMGISVLVTLILNEIEVKDAILMISFYRFICLKVKILNKCKYFSFISYNINVRRWAFI